MSIPHHFDPMGTAAGGLIDTGVYLPKDVTVVDSYRVTTNDGLLSFVSVGCVPNALKLLCYNEPTTPASGIYESFQYPTKITFIRPVWVEKIRLNFYFLQSSTRTSVFTAFYNGVETPLGTVTHVVTPQIQREIPVGQMCERITITQANNVRYTALSVVYKK